MDHSYFSLNSYPVNFMDLPKNEIEDMNLHIQDDINDNEINF